MRMGRCPCRCFTPRRSEQLLDVWIFELGHAASLQKKKRNGGKDGQSDVEILRMKKNDEKKCNKTTQAH